MNGTKLQRLGLAFALLAVASVSPEWYGGNYDLLAPIGVLLVGIGLFVPDDDAERQRLTELSERIVDPYDDETEDTAEPSRDDSSSR